MAIEVFNRYEKKYQIDQKAYEALTASLQAHMKPDAYSTDGAFYTIANVYYDTEESTLIRRSLARPFYKEKVRLRSYGKVEPEDMVYLEIKKKVNKLVNKRRTRLKLHEALNFLETGKRPALQPYMNAQVLRELEYLIRSHPLKPAVYLSYDREAYFAKEDAGLRISFDKNIRARHGDISLAHEPHGELLLEPGQWLMEIKAEKSIPLWLSRLLSEHSIYPASFSKYGKAYLEQVEQNKNRRWSACSISYSPAAQTQSYHPAVQY